MIDIEFKFNITYSFENLKWFIASVVNGELLTGFSVK